MKANKTKPLPLPTTDNSSKFISFPPYTPSLALFLLVILQHLTTTTALGNETDHIALLAIKSQLVDQPGGILSSWNHSVHHCYWQGVICGHKHGRVTLLDLNSQKVSGTISPFIGNMSFLRELWLYNNTLHGQIPPEVGRLFTLRRLQLNNNTIVGQVPANLSGCINLQSLNVEYNNLGGKLPRGLGSLSKLKWLSFYRNNFRGPLFEVVGNLTSLVHVDCYDNAFTGTIHDNIGGLKNLKWLQLGKNKLSGKIPPSLFNLSSLELLSLSFNQLQGGLSRDIGFRLPQLVSLYLSHNNFSGPIPISIQNLTSLKALELRSSNFNGEALDFGHLHELQRLDLNSNHLQGGLNFIDTLVNCSSLELLELGNNNFIGALPKSLANLSTNLVGLGLGENQLSGEILMAIANFVHLKFLTLEGNELIGTIPHDIGKLHLLEILNMGSNRLIGGIPDLFGNLSRLTALGLGGNKLQGSIPPSLGNCQNMLILDLSQNDLNGTLPNELFGGSAKFLQVNLFHNHLEGPLPLEISKQINLVELYISGNKLSGEIPNGLGSCPMLQNLDMSFNSFHGNIPPSFTSLKSLLNLNLSHNSLTGSIPDFFSRFPLEELRLSYNNFEGRVPLNGVFANASAVFLVGNPKLCGGIPELHLPRCMEKKIRKRKRMTLALKLTIPMICALVGVSMAAWLYLTCRKEKKSIEAGPLINESFLQVSYNMLLKATYGFSSENLLGAGSFGSVYKGTLELLGRTVAVKVLNLEHQGASKSFMAECKALRNIRHRNLVGIVTVCSSIDFQGNDFKALIYEFMPNGSLERCLYEVGNVSLVQRVHIAIDVASALDYLHHGGESPLVHCDLKPSNVLLDDDMVAHVGDFGLAKFVFQQQNLTQSSTTGIRGTVGYVAPEYGLGGVASTEGDVYSFGILLLELMTGKRPTDNMFKEDFTLHMYAKEALHDPDQVLQIIDPILVQSTHDEEGNDEIRLTQATLQKKAKCMISMVTIGVACSEPSPLHRMNVTDAISELTRARDIISNARRIRHNRQIGT